MCSCPDEAKIFPDELHDSEWQAAGQRQERAKEDRRSTSAETEARVTVDASRAFPADPSYADDLELPHFTPGHFQEQMFASCQDRDLIRPLSGCKANVRELSCMSA